MKNLSRKGKISLIVTIICYFLFAFLILSIIAYGTNTIQKWIIVVIFTIILIAGIFIEILKQQYYKALHALNFELNSKKAVALFDELEKKDFLKGYKNTRVLFDVQVSIFENRYRDALTIIKNNEQMFRRDLEMLSIMQYSKLRCYVVLKDQKRASEAYRQLKMISSQKKAPKIFPQDEIEGLYQMAIKNNFSAYKHFKNINMKNMNTREMQFIITCLKNLTPYSAEREEFEEQLENIENLRWQYEK